MTKNSCSVYIYVLHNVSRRSQAANFNRHNIYVVSIVVRVIGCDHSPLKPGAKRATSVMFSFGGGYWVGEWPWVCPAIISFTLALLRLHYAFEQGYLYSETLGQNRL